MVNAGNLEPCGGTARRRRPWWGKGGVRGEPARVFVGLVDREDAMLRVHVVLGDKGGLRAYIRAGWCLNEIEWSGVGALGWERVCGIRWS